MKRAMEVILLERVPNLGQMGDVVAVRPGFARNFLLPREKALRATEANKQAFEARRKEIEAQNLERRKEAESVAGRMSDARIVLVRQAGESGQLYGSVSARDIATGLSGQGYQVERTQVELERPIKTLGIYNVTIRLHPEVSVTVKANVARSEGEAEQQWTAGGAVVGEAAGAGAPADETEEEIQEIDTDQLVAELLEEEERAKEAVAETREAMAESAEDTKSAEDTESGEAAADDEPGKPAS